MVKSEREEVFTALTSRILSSLLDELVLDCTLQAHREVAKTTTTCRICNTRCSSVHLPPSLTSSGALNAPSRSGTPSSNGDLKSHTGSTPTAGKSNGNLLLECISCSRQIASNRYAPHLSSCMGLSNSRRAAPRSKLKPPSDAGRSASPSSEVGYQSDDKSVGKSKPKAKGEDDDFTLKRKRPSSPQITPSKKSKGKLSGSPISRVKADPDISGVPGGSHYSPTTKSQSRIPSKLRDSSIAPYNEDNYSSSSRSSSPEAASVPTPASSSFTRSPALNSRPVPAKRGRPPGTGPPKRLSPPRPAAPVIHFDMDVDGDETGSSTDSSSE